MLLLLDQDLPNVIKFGGRPTPETSTLCRVITIMKDYTMGADHHFPSASEALKYCLNLASSGNADLFRGQSHDWPVIAPSLFRGQADTQAKARALLHEFQEWGETVPQMATYHGSTKAITAIAQHYGIPTATLDLTTSPEIAELFACGTTEIAEAGEAVIYCFRSEDLQNLPSFSLVKLDVINLWRLQAQQGLFLEFHDGAPLDEVRSMAIRVHFPRRSITPSEVVRLYPVRKSALEIVIDQWIYRHSISQLFDQLSGIKNVRLIRRYTYPGVFRWREVPQLEGRWLSYNPGWIFPSPEDVGFATDCPIFEVSLDTAEDPEVAFAALSAQLRPPIEAYADTGVMIAFGIQIAGRNYESANASLLLNRCWDGIRTHPYQTGSAVACMAATALALIRPVLHPDADDWEEILWGQTEAIDTAPVGGHLDAASVSTSKLIAARHAMYDEGLTAYARRRTSGDPLFLMDYVVDPWVLFDFELLSAMFVEQFVPSCIGFNWRAALDSDDRKLSELWGLSFNPALLAFVTRFGFRFTSPISSEADVDHLILILPDMDENDIEEVFLSALPSVLEGGNPFTVRFCGYSQDPRELWQIESVIEQCRVIVRTGGISVLEVFPGLREAGLPKPDGNPGAFGAIHIWAIATGQLGEISGVDLRDKKHIIDQFWEDLGQCNATLEAKGKAQPDWPATNIV